MPIAELLDIFLNGTYGAGCHIADTVKSSRLG
jgi:hypothetical protein